MYEGVLKRKISNQIVIAIYIVVGVIGVLFGIGQILENNFYEGLVLLLLGFNLQLNILIAIGEKD